jgi:hypothetical protein
MTTSPDEPAIPYATATGVRFTDTMLYLALSDGREIGVPLAHYPWLARATPRQRADWAIEPGGYAVFWEALDDGLEVANLLTPHRLA